MSNHEMDRPVAQFASDHIEAAMAQGLAEFSYEVYFAATRPEIGSPLEAAFIGCWDVYHRFRHLRFWLVPQFDVQVAWDTTYRLDFILLPDYLNGFNRRDTPPIKVAVELDGHDFHERTKAQVIKRDKRDRDLECAGWTVMHFSGSEFNANPWRCIQDVEIRAYHAELASRGFAILPIAKSANV